MKIVTTTNAAASAATTSSASHPTPIGNAKNVSVWRIVRNVGNGLGIVYARSGTTVKRFSSNTERPPAKKWNTVTSARGGHTLGYRKYGEIQLGQLA
jgi:hypothetical protein